MSKERISETVSDFFKTEAGVKYLAPVRSGVNQLSDNNSRHFKMKKKIRYIGGK